ncbi:hypothetical protein J2D73_19530 [Acetobacter sacchari]|uniref:Uncharacterized protein n=1 Tax=Acetobacter sacchari TaxID=2661687 RepID=A0ABS3M1G8_9PROT|nr:hypothetical protein [Acetobacter sacchari]MBO1361977.1 hypothetical protein [Acetobacter sacchari]
MTPPDGHLDTWINLGGSLLGAIIGGGVSILTTRWTISEKNHAEIKSENQKIKQTLLAIRSEIDTVYTRYYKEAGQTLETVPSQNAVPIFYPVEEEYFPVYKNNTIYIGYIQNELTVQHLIKCYTLAAGLIDSIRLNNAMYSQYVALHSAIESSCSEDNKKAFVGRRDSLLEEYREYWERLRQHHFELRETAKLAYTGINVEIERRDSK